MISALLALGCWLLFRRMWRAEPRRLRTAALLLVGAWFAWGAVVEFIAYFSPQLQTLLGLVLLALPFSVLVLAGFLIRNGLQMARREGRSLGNLLSLLAGIALLALPVVGFLLVATLHPVGLGAAALAFFLSAQVGLSFLTFLVFTVTYARRPPRPGADAVVVLGSGLVNGAVSPLLASRLDRGGQAWLAQRTALPMIPSGGQGPDEPRAEAAAMAEYLVEHGVPAGQVLPEDRSRTTEENLRFSRAVADSALPEGAAPGHLLVATNNYHAPRAALLSRRIGVDADVVGGDTAGYYVPSAYLREFVAVMVMHRRTQLALALPGLLLSIGLTALMVMYRLNSGA
ncbi:YdcF family protein [Citricoccus sp. I39-566]|uniref:YdcF family protein n=1 Tax=Citricoccus sp. I39-566 TaxID=3073268 RepID=UPI00286A92AD|nr:YdcF family protein [Citricoccus sp. I39-566]WMY78586.1 YdcF family protein [Citricoccus sp. I39-566]